LWVFKQAGHFSDISKSASSESNTIISVVSPVGTARLLIGQRIMILGIGLRALPTQKKADMQKPKATPIKMQPIKPSKNIAQ
jgi:hypothetical protein